MTAFKKNPTLADLREFTEQTLTMFSELDIPDIPEAYASRDRAQALAAELQSRLAAPVTIGVVGEYSVGKSLLLGTLLGKPDLLPVEAGPSTGNITVLELSRGEPGSSTQKSDTAEVTFLTESQLAQCVGVMLEELVRALDERHPQLGAAAALAGYNPVTDERGWGPFDAWYPRLWPVSGGPVQHEAIGALYRDAVTELCRIRDAALSQRDLLGKPVGVATAVMDEALTLESAQRTPEVPPKRVVRPFDIAQLRHSDEGTAQEAMRRAFPLVERVTVQVTVSPDHWDLAGLISDDNPVRLMDFPGINAAGSSGRDTFLSRREMVSVHTILLVISALRPESKGASAFWDMLTADGREAQALASAALVAANAFDLAKPPALRAVPDGPLPLRQLLAHSAEINGIHVYGNKFVQHRENGIVVTSSMAAIRAYQLPYTKTSEETRDRIQKALRDLDPPGVKRWENIAGRLRQADEGNPWSDRLRAYDSDGGIERLRRLVESHVREHGLDQKLERARSSHRKLWRELAVLRGLVRRARGEEPPEEYRELAEKLGEFRELLDQMLPTLYELRSSGNRVNGGYDGVSAADLGGRPPQREDIAASVRDDVFDWREWQELLGRAERDGHHLVPRSQPPSRTGIKPIVRPGRSPSVNEDPDTVEDTADVTDAFLTKFRTLVDRRITDGQAQLRVWFEGWAAHWQDEFGPLREWMLDPSVDKLLGDLFTRLRGGERKADRQLDHLWTALNPAEVRSQIENLVVAPGPTPQEQENRFPMRAPHALPWDHRMPRLDDQRSEERERHPLLVVQLRQHTADAAARLVTEHLGQALARVERDLVGLYSKAADFLPQENEIRPPRKPRSTGTGATGEAPETPETPAEEPLDTLIRDWSAD
ncbi:dynamin family protein [Streptomyces olivochromogenes]|uniref:dynamin family protein n=1 Tax=Streptomyces olivochromogenes TaxID=1963 RepID=UPI001F38E661|nr:dynamin family protein [Streptomyces olivochromogenes]MCF3130385.1 dynamin family protein [Streptomyces olivochromogenes]